MIKQTPFTRYREALGNAVTAEPEQSNVVHADFRNGQKFAQPESSNTDWRESVQDFAYEQRKKFYAAVGLSLVMMGVTSYDSAPDYSGLAKCTEPAVAGDSIWKFAGAAAIELGVDRRDVVADIYEMNSIGKTLEIGEEVTFYAPTCD